MYIGSLWATQQQRLQIAITTGTLFRALPSSAPQQRPFHYRGFNSLLSVLPVCGSAVVYGLEVQKLSSLAAPYTLLGWRLLAV